MYPIITTASNNMASAVIGLLGPRFAFSHSSSHAFLSSGSHFSREKCIKTLLQPETIRQKHTADHAINKYKYIFIAPPFVPFPVLTSCEHLFYTVLVLNCHNLPLKVSTPNDGISPLIYSKMGICGRSDIMFDIDSLPPDMQIFILCALTSYPRQGESPEEPRCIKP